MAQAPVPQAWVMALPDPGSDGCAAAVSDVCAAAVSDVCAAVPLPCRGGGRGGVSIFNMRELNVTALWEGGMMLKDASHLAHLVDVVGEDDVMGVAHGDEEALIQSLIGQKK